MLLRISTASPSLLPAAAAAGPALLLLLLLLLRSASWCSQGVGSSLLSG
jgi:hypothetical protein